MAAQIGDVRCTRGFLDERRGTLEWVDLGVVQVADHDLLKLLLIVVGEGLGPSDVCAPVSSKIAPQSMTGEKEVIQVFGMGQL
jgi:hypothetical protein